MRTRFSAPCPGQRNGLVVLLGIVPELFLTGSKTPCQIHKSELYCLTQVRVSRALGSPHLIQGRLLASWLCDSSLWKPHPLPPPTPCMSRFSQEPRGRIGPGKAQPCHPQGGSPQPPLSSELSPAGLCRSAHCLADSLGLVLGTHHVSRAGDRPSTCPITP